MESNKNMEIWGRVAKTDPFHTKNFSRGGGFSGTAINANYLARKATEMFGPIGDGWGVEILEEDFREGGPLGFDKDGNALGREVIHVLRVELWYMRGEKRCSVKQFGQTTFVGKNKYGCFTDEEAPKKSLTDGMTKCLSLLGFGSDVHLGMYDDNKYVNALREEFSEAKEAEKAAAKQEKQQAPKANQAKPQQGQQGQQAQERSVRFGQYKTRILEGGIADVEAARLVIQSDQSLNDSEKNELLEMKEMRVPATAN